MAHDLNLGWKEGMSETCSYSFDAIAGAANNLQTEGMTEAQLSKNALNGEWGVIKGMQQSGKFKAGQTLFTGKKLDGTTVRIFSSLDTSKLSMAFETATAKTLQLVDLQYFEDKWLHSDSYIWNLGKATKKLDVAPVSDSIGAMSDEDVATMFVKTKDDLAKQKGILDLKGTNKALDDEVYDAIAKQTGYTKAEIKAKVDAYKASGKKLSALKKKVVKKDKNVPHPNGVPIQPTKEAVQDAVKQVADKVDQSPTIASKVYQDEDVASAYIKAKDDLASLESNDWTLYTQSDEFNASIYDRMRDIYGISLDDSAIEKQIANYVGNGNKLSVLKKKLAKSKDDPWKPKADTLKKSKESVMHVTAPKAGEMPAPAPPSDSFAGTKVEDLSSEYDIFKLDPVHRQTVYDKFKAKSGTYLTSSPESIYEAAAQVANDLGKLYGFGENDVLAVLKIVDERGAVKFGVTNENLFEKKLVEWLQTPAGKDYFQKKAEAEYWLKNQPPLPDDSSLFQVIDTSQARQMQNTMGTWTTEEKTALTQYTGSWYSEMNGFLRGRIRDASPNVRTMIRNAKKGMRRVTRNILVHRGTSFKQFGVSSFEELARLVGMDITDEGFVSTSVGGRAAFSGNTVLMEIEVPVGSMGAYVKPISLHPSENELILAPGTRFRVLQVKKVGHQTTVRVRVLV